MQSARNVFKNYLCRFYSSNQTHVLEQLKSRHLIRVSGDESAMLLQGLITNDIQQLSQGAGNFYALILNNKGRVLYDTIIYRPSLEPIYYLEVDSQVSDLVKKHLSMYRLRKKIDITIDSHYRLWVHFDPTKISNTTLSNKEELKEENILDEEVVPCTAIETLPNNNYTSKIVGEQEMHIFRDPRLPALGSRILAPVDCDSSILKLFKGVKEPTYKWFRYRLGIGEGVEELPPGNCFPLEANCDYLHGISFTKGCYIGQELTARTYHTGVVRKRLMPLIFAKHFLNYPAKDEPVKSGEASVGKLRGFEKDSGLALLRIAPALEAEKLTIKNISICTFRPSWWPIEIAKPKERVSSGEI